MQPSSKRELEAVLAASLSDTTLATLNKRMHDITQAEDMLSRISQTALGVLRAPSHDAPATISYHFERSWRTAMLHPLLMAESSALTAWRQTVSTAVLAREPEREYGVVATAVLARLNKGRRAVGPNTERPAVQPDGSEPACGLAEHGHDEL